MNADEIVMGLRESCTGNELAPSMVTNREITEAADLIESLQAQHKQAALNYQQKCRDVVELEAQLAELRKECDIADAANTALHGALEESQRRERAAVNNMTAVLKRDSGDICKYCEHIIECKGQACDGYCSGAGDIDGNYPNWKWTCEDFVLGTCVKMENTPCNGCFENDYGGFEWRGPQTEKGETHE